MNDKIGFVGWWAVVPFALLSLIAFLAVYGALALAHFALFTALELTTFVLNCVLSPWEAVVHPLVDLFVSPKKKGEFVEVTEGNKSSKNGFLAVITSEDWPKLRRLGLAVVLLLSALSITLIVLTVLLSGGAALPVALLPVITPFVSIVTPVLQIMAGGIGVLFSQIIIGVVLSLVTVGFWHRFVSLEWVESLGARVMDACSVAPDPFVKKTGGGLKVSKPTHSEEGALAASSSEKGASPYASGASHQIHNTPKGAGVYSETDIAALSWGKWFVYGAAQQVTGCGKDAIDWYEGKGTENRFEVMI